MAFTASTYANFVAESPQARERLFRSYDGPRNDFDVIVVGSGIGGGVLADDLAERIGGQRRILVLEAGSFLYPTHVYNFGRIPNAALARHFGCDTFWQGGDSGTQNYIGEKPQLNLGGRSIWWSGLIPAVQGWELDFFPARVRQDLEAGLLSRAGETMNESRSMGATARAIVARLRQSELSEDFFIQETPRALHQPYLAPDGTPKDQFFTEPTGVFNTAELLINQVGLTPGLRDPGGPGLHLLPDHFVEDVQDHGGQYVLVTSNTLTGAIRSFRAPTVVLAGGSVESPKLLRRSSSLFAALPGTAQDLVGRGLTDHPTSNELTAFVSNLDTVAIPHSTHAKIVFYSRGRRDGAETRYPFNVEMNVNHEYWHLRDNDPNDGGSPDPSTATGASRLDIKFSFGNCLDDGNQIMPAPPFGYVPEIAFRNLSWMDHLTGSRFPAVAGWHKTFDQTWDVMNGVADRIFSQFELDGQRVRLSNDVRFGKGKGFGWGTVHHAAGSLRMPYRTSRDSPFVAASVVDEDLRVAGTQNLYVCDMSVMPFSSAANPVRTLVALALRLSEHLS